MMPALIPASRKCRVSGVGCNDSLDGLGVLACTLDGSIRYSMLRRNGFGGVRQRDTLSFWLGVLIASVSAVSLLRPVVPAAQEQAVGIGREVASA
jgi:hypothetical protein